MKLGDGRLRWVSKIALVSEVTRGVLVFYQLWNHGARLGIFQDGVLFKHGITVLYGRHLSITIHTFSNNRPVHATLVVR